MAGFYPGQANTFADLKSAIESALVTEGWTLSDGILSKGGGYFQLTPSAGYLALQGGTGQAGAVLTDASPYDVRIASLAAVDPISWPIDYEISVSDSPDEVYAVILYNGDRVQTLAFGISPAPGNPTGYWISGAGGPGTTFTSATAEYSWASFGSTASQDAGYNIGPGCDWGNQDRRIAAGVLTSQVWSNGRQSRYPYWYHNGTAWGPTGYQMGDGGASGGGYAAWLLVALPSQYNWATVLVPAYLFEWQSDFRAIPMLELAHMRHCRIDAYSAGDVVQYGPDKWKVYPQARKNSEERQPLGSTNHTGTYGFAVRYHGP